MALKIVAVYTHGTNKYWCYEHYSDEGIFKFWIPHTKKIAEGKYRSLPPPTTMDFHVEFAREGQEDAADN